MDIQYSAVAAPAAAAAEPPHPALWRAHQLGRVGAGAGCATGFTALDAVLPGRGWPQQAISELLLSHPGIGELRLLAPALAAVQQAGRGLMWFDPPAAPCPWALAALGIDLRRLVVVNGQGQGAAAGNRRRRGASPPAAGDTLWALEHALKSGHLGAIVAWLPVRLPADALRRLQLAAQAHDGPVFLLRPAAARTAPSAAPLRMALSSAGPDRLCVAVFKRRGPPVAAPLMLELPPVLSEPARERSRRVRRPPAVAAAAAAAATTAAAVPAHD
jgi:protein ImuA